MDKFTELTGIQRPLMKGLLSLWIFFCVGSVYADIPESCSIQPFSLTSDGLDTQVSVTGGLIGVRKVLSGNVVLSEDIPFSTRTFSLIREEDDSLTIEFTSTEVNRTFDISIPLGTDSLTPADLPFEVTVDLAEFCLCGSNTDLWTFAGRRLFL